jgi:hypothetical protein
LVLAIISDEEGCLGSFEQFLPQFLGQISAEIPQAEPLLLSTLYYALSKFSSLIAV